MTDSTSAFSESGYEVVPSLAKGDAIIITYDPQKMVGTARKKYVNGLLRSFKKTFPENKIVVVDNTVSVSILR
jgi:hypothetical protein